ncbi:hypothetical protein CP061683_0541A, partial [Chlamydia psittaci 06-1683]
MISFQQSFSMRPIKASVLLI